MSRGVGGEFGGIDKGREREPLTDRKRYREK